MRRIRWKVTERDLKRLEDRSGRSVILSQLSGNDQSRSHVLLGIRIKVLHVEKLFPGMREFSEVKVAPESTVHTAYLPNQFMQSIQTAILELSKRSRS